jgi:hypothetical protein
MAPNQDNAQFWPIHRKLQVDVQKIMDTRIWLADRLSKVGDVQIRAKAGAGVEEVIIHVPAHYRYATDVFLRKFAFCKELVKVAYNVKTVGASSDAKTKMQIVVDGAERNVIYHQNVWIDFIIDLEQKLYPGAKATQEPISDMDAAKDFQSPTMRMWLLQEYYINRHDPLALTTRADKIDHTADPLALRKCSYTDGMAAGRSAFTSQTWPSRHIISLG